jgi:hypothetical protein
MGFSRFSAESYGMDLTVTLCSSKAEIKYLEIEGITSCEAKTDLVNVAMIVMVMQSLVVEWN